MSAPTRPGRAHGRIETSLIRQIKRAMPIEQVVGRDVQLQRNGSGRVGRCPFHPDNDPSFHVYQDPDDPHYHCFGCGAHGDIFDYVAQLEGLSFRQALERFAHSAGVQLPSPNGAGSASRTKTTKTLEYKYLDADGKLLAIHGRTEDERGKKVGGMPWYTPQGSKAGQPGLAGIKISQLPPYGLPELLQADSDEPIIVSEGEKACDALRERGFVAISFAGGCNQRDFGDALEYLRGRKIYLWPDEDQVGEAFMDAVAAALQTVAAEVLRLQPAGAAVQHKDDAFDYFASGKGPDSLRIMMEYAPLYQPHIRIQGSEAGPEDAALSTGLPRHEIRATLRSGLQAGMREPRQVPEPTSPTHQASDAASIGDATAQQARVRFPDSRPHKQSGIGNQQAPDGGPAAPVPIAHLVRVWEQSEPKPRRFVVEGLIPEGVTSTLYGDGGTLKSYTGLRLSMHVCLGLPFAGRLVQRGSVLYLDAELDADEFTRRSYKIARGLGLSAPAEGLYYFALPDSLADAAVQAMVRTLVAECDPTLIVLDSLTIASYTVDMNEAPTTITVMKYLESLRTVLAIDHIPKPMAGANLSHYRQFGSVFKGNLARSAIQMLRADGGGVSIVHRKCNFSALSEPIHLAVEFEENAVRFVQIDATDERLAGIDVHLPAQEQVFAVLASTANEPDPGGTPEWLAQQTGKSVQTIRNHLTNLRKQGRVEKSGGKWIPVIPDSRSLKESGIGNEEDVEAAEGEQDPPF